MMNTIVAIIATLVSNCIMNVTIITASNNASLSIPAPVLFCYHCCYSYGHQAVHNDFGFRHGKSLV